MKILLLYEIVTGMPFSLLTRPSRLQGDSSLILSQENISVLRATKKLGESDEDEEEMIKTSRKVAGKLQKL